MCIIPGQKIECIRGFALKYGAICHGDVMVMECMHASPTYCMYVHVIESVSEGHPCMLSDEAIRTVLIMQTCSTYILYSGASDIYMDVVM